MCLFTQTLRHWQYVTRGQFLSSLNTKFPFTQTKKLTLSKESSLPYYLPITWVVKKEMNPCLIQGDLHEVKHQQG